MLYKIFLFVCLLILLLLGFQKVLADDTQISPKIPIIVQVKYTEEFNRIGGCESVGNPYGKWDYHAKNKHSSASGVFEWINSSWYHYGLELWGEDFYTKNIWTKDNVDLAWYVYEKYGTKDWLSSKDCWDKT